MVAGCRATVPATAPVLRVGTSGDYPPFSLARNGQSDGFDLEVARRFARDSGQRLEIVRFRWPDLRADLAAGRFDLAMGGVTMRPERAMGAAFTRPVAATGAVVLVRTGQGAEALDAAGVRLAVNAGGHLERVAHRLFPHATLLPIPDNLLLPEVVDTGGADGLVTDDIEADLLAARMGPVVRRGPFTRDRKAYLGRDAGLVDRLDAWLRAREADGTLAALRAAWLGPRHATPRTAFASDLDALVALIDLRLAFMPAVAAAKAVGRRVVEDPAQEARVLAAARAEAAAAGLEPAAAAELFAAQLAAARAVQRAWLAVPPADRAPVEPLDLETEARPALAALSRTIVARAAAVAADPVALAALDPARVAAALDPSLAPAADRETIATAVLGLRPATGHPAGTPVGAPGLALGHTAALWP